MVRLVSEPVEVTSQGGAHARQVKSKNVIFSVKICQNNVKIFLFLRLKT